MRWLTGLAVVTFLTFAAPALGASDFKVPPTPDHFVTDNAGALSSATRSSIENELRDYQKSTGHQLIVWIGQTTGDVPLETWTGDSAHQWRIGRKGHDDGAILFLFMKDHKVRIEVGYGLESSLTDADSSRIIQDYVVPKMRSSDVDGAVSGGTAAMIKTISPSYGAVSPPPVAENESPEGSVAAAIMIGVFAVFGLVMIFIVVMLILRMIYGVRYGYLVLREGSKKAKTDMKHSAFWGGALGGLATSSSFGGSSSGSGSDSFDSGFSAGGGDFGGGGASGSW